MAYDRYPVRERRSNEPRFRSNQPQHGRETDSGRAVDYGGQPASRTRFYRDKQNGKVMGVCAGIADYTGFDVALVRICFLATVFLSGGSVRVPPVLMEHYPDLQGIAKNKGGDLRTHG